jgi:transposase InsO family protein
MCQVLEVTEQGYYKWLKIKDRPDKHATLLAKIKNIRNQYPENKNYGVERLQLALKNNEQIEISRSTLYRICKKYGLLIKRKRRPKGLTKADLKAQASENIIKQDFTAQAPNQKWLGDITEIPTADGKLYLAAVLDCYDGSIVGFKMDRHMKATLPEEAFILACKRYQASGMIFHSDRGSQYTSRKYRKTLHKYHAIQSMSFTGRCYDNSRMESFFATLKKEKLYQINTKELSISAVKSIIFRYIEIYYNRKRIYTTNQGFPPLIYRNRYYQNIQNKAA